MYPTSGSPGKAKIFLAAGTVILLLTVAMNVRTFITSWVSWVKIDENQYSQSRSNTPLSLIPLPEHPYNARLVIEDTVHYEPSANAEWETLFPPGGGFVQLGSSHSLFIVSMYHQLHCLDILRRAVIDPPSDEEKSDAHFCLNYVRQALLCASDITVEHLKDMPNGPGVDGLGLEHSCRDWTVLRRKVEKNVREWSAGA